MAVPQNVEDNAVLRRREVEPFTDCINNYWGGRYTRAQYRIPLLMRPAIYWRAAASIGLKLVGGILHLVTAHAVPLGARVARRTEGIARLTLAVSAWAAPVAYWAWGGATSGHFGQAHLR